MSFFDELDNAELISEGAIKKLIDSYKLNKEESRNSNDFHEKANAAFNSASFADIATAIKSYDSTTNSAHLLKISWSLNFLTVARTEDRKKAVNLAKSLIKQALADGVSTSAIRREINSQRSLGQYRQQLLALVMSQQEQPVQESVEIEEFEMVSESLENLLESLDDIDELLESTMDSIALDEAFFAERKLKRAERKLKVAKMAREEIDRIEASKMRHSTPGQPYGAGASNNLTARSIARGKVRADERIERAQRKVDKARKKLEESVVPETIPGNGVKETTSSKSVYVKVQSQQTSDLEPNAGAGTVSEVIPGKGVVTITSGQNVYGKVAEKQTDDMEAVSESIERLLESLDDVEDLLDESMELVSLGESFAERKLKRAERKLKVAKLAREEIDRVEATKKRHVTPGAIAGVGASNNLTARSIARGKARADERIERAQRKVDKARRKLMESTTVAETIPGNGVKATTTEKNVYGRVQARQTTDMDAPASWQTHDVKVKVGQSDSEQELEIIKKDVETDELMAEDMTIEYFDAIVLTEDQVRVFSQYGKYIISESDFEACCAYYDGESEETVLGAIAEANGINVEDLHVMLVEASAATKKPVKKAMLKKGTADREAQVKRTQAKIRRLQEQLKDTAPGSATATKLRAKIKELKASIR